ncbi:MAG: IS1380 family transposase, partial [Stellaceae bacterium]
QYLCAAVLRPGNAPTQQGTLPLLRRIVGRLQERFPNARILVRLDGGFAAPELFEWLDEVGVDYVVAMAKNAVLERLVELDMIVARVLSEQSGRTEHVYGEGRYAAQTWERERRVIYKAEVVHHPGKEPRDNPRFVITNLTRTPRRLYERVYCQRGELENRLKELELGLQIGRTSCSRFSANQLRVLLTATAYLLMQEVRLKAAHTRWARAQVWTLREQLIKLGAHLVGSVRRNVLHLPASYPFRDAWYRVAMALGATPG